MQVIPFRPRYYTCLSNCNLEAWCLDCTLQWSGDGSTLTWRRIRQIVTIAEIQQLILPKLDVELEVLSQLTIVEVNARSAPGLLATPTNLQQIVAPHWLLFPIAIWILMQISLRPLAADRTIGAVIANLMCSVTAPMLLAAWKEQSSQTTCTPNWKLPI